MPYDPEKPLLFQHIPKCGGTSVRRVFRSWFGQGLITHYFNAEKGGLPERRDLDALQAGDNSSRGICLFGHFNRTRGFGVEQYYPGIEQKITIMRDPFEQHVSQYYYTRRKMLEGKENLPLVRDGGGDPGDLEAYVANRRSGLLSYLPEGINEENYREVLGENYLFIGIAERMDDTINLMSDLLRKPPLRVPVKNASERTGDADRIELRGIFSERNRLEVAIYEECLDRFREGAACSPWNRLTRSFRRRFRI